MNNWCNFFDKIYLINLPSRPDRLEKSTAELGKYNIPFEVFPAIKHDDGRQGIYLTVKKIFEEVLANNIKRPLLFEDDVRILHDPSAIMPKVLEQLPADYDMLFLGCNHPKPLECFSPNLFKVNSAKALHAVSYSQNAIKKLMPHFATFTHAIDRIPRDVLQPHGKSFCTYPMLCSQYAGYSDIEEEIVDYTHCIEERFEKGIKGAKMHEPRQTTNKK